MATFAPIYCWSLAEMRRNWRGGALFLLLYLMALAATAPVSLAVKLLPGEVIAEDATGAVWKGNFRNLRWKNITLSRLSWQWGWYNGRPGVSVVANGETGRIEAAFGWLGSWWVAGGRWQASAQRLAAVMERAGIAPPLPLEASGEVILRLDRLRFTLSECLDLAAELDWRDAALSASGQRLSLGAPRLELNCQGRTIHAALHQPAAPLPLSAEGRLALSGDYRVFLRAGPADALPAQWLLILENITRPADGGQRIMEISGKWIRHPR
jgi:general secretion pathway protein N